MAVAVDQNHIVRSAQRADERQVGLIAGAEDDRVPFAKPLREVALEVFVQRQRAIRRPRARGTGAVLAYRAPRGFHHVGMKRQPEIVVGSEHQRRTAVDGHFARPNHAVDHRLARQGAAVGKHRTAFLDDPQFLEEIHRVSARGRARPGPWSCHGPSPRRSRNSASLRFKPGWHYSHRLLDINQLPAFVSRFGGSPLDFSAGRAADGSRRHERDGVDAQPEPVTDPPPD